MTRVIESLLLIEFQIFVKFDPGQKSGSFIKFPRAQQPITFLWKEKRKKKKEESAAALSKSAKNSPGQTAAAAPRLVPLNFRSSTERQRVDRVCFSSLRGWLEGRCAAGGNTLQGEKLGNSPLFRAIHANFFARCIVQTQLVRLLGSKGNMKPETTGLVHQERDHRGENLFSPTRKLRSVWWYFFFFKNSSLISVDLFNFSTMHDCPIIFFNNNSTIRVCKFYMYIFFYNSWSSSL